MSESGPGFATVEATLRRAAALLRDAGIDFALAGSVAAWARGGPTDCNDVDLLVREADAEAALRALERGGMRGERPPEGWLYKAWDGDVLVDVIFELAGSPDTDALLRAAEVLTVSAMPLAVLSADELLIAKLLALGEHRLDFTRLLQIVRALREQIDWATVQARTSESPYARSFLHLVDALQISAARAQVGG